MNKQELINTMKETGKLRRVEAERGLNAFIEVVKNALIEGERVVIRGFGTFYVVERKERKGRNPLTGEAIIIPGKKVVKFKPSKEIKRLIR